MTPPAPLQSSPRFATLASLLAAIALGCTADPGGHTGDSAAQGDACSGEGGFTDPATGFPNLRCTQAANDGEYFWFAREAIELAQERIHLIEYLWYDSGSAELLLEELVDAAGRGVEVKVLADESVEETADSLARLRDSSGGAIQAKSDSRSTVSHNKLIIADDLTLVGSHNMSSSALSSNHESSLYLTEADVTDYYEGYFQSMWVDSDTDPSLQKPARDDLVPIKNREIAGQLQSCLDGAQARVRLVMYALVTYDDASSPVYTLTQRLLAAHDRGVDVMVVLDQSDWIASNDINTGAIAQLQARGVPLHLADRDITTHAKMLMCDDTVIVGDANWSFSSMEEYNGTSVQVTRARVADQYLAWFDEIWDEGEEP